MLLKADPPAKAWYPTGIGQSRTQAGEDAWLLYTYWQHARRTDRKYVA